MATFLETELLTITFLLLLIVALALYVLACLHAYDRRCANDEDADELDRLLKDGEMHGGDTAR